MTHEESEKRIEVRFAMRLGHHAIDATAKLPPGPMRPAELLPVLLPFNDAFLGMVQAAIAEQGTSISCRSGCAACCRRLVPVSESEAHYLAALVSELPEAEQAKLRERFAAALAELDRRGLLARLRNASGLRNLPDWQRLATEYVYFEVACPFLEDERCSIYEHRPMKCREHMVTSPPENCALGRPDQVRAVPLPAQFSELLFRFGDAKGEDAPRWVPLALALEWAAGREPADQPALPGPDLFRNFLVQIAPLPPEDASRAA